MWCGVIEDRRSPHYDSLSHRCGRKQTGGRHQEQHNKYVESSTVRDLTVTHEC